MPVHDGEQFLREAVESVLAQTLSDLELIVVDDGSADASPEILAEYASADERLVVRRTEHLGQADARNAGVAAARSELIAFLDHDDVAHPERLARQQAFMDAHPEVALVGGAVTFIDRKGRAFVEDVPYPLTDEAIRAALPEMTPVVTSAAFVWRRAFDEVGGFRRLYADSEDLDLWLRLADHHELANLPETVVRYRVHRGSASARRVERQSMTSLAARLSALARAEGRPYPFEHADRIDRETLLAHGATQEDMTRTFVSVGTSLAKGLHRSGEVAAAESLLEDLLARARSSGSRELADRVRAARSRLEAESRRSWRGRIRSLLSR
jgi:glycosyltransferase involved in cell wall biosynthesis